MHRKRPGDEATSTTEIIRDEFQPALCVRGLPKMRDKINIGDWYVHYDTVLPPHT